MKEWATKELGVDAFHHLVYAVTTGGLTAPQSQDLRP